MLFLLALAIGIVVAAICHNYAPKNNALVRVAATVAGFIIGYSGTYIVVANIPK